MAIPQQLSGALAENLLTLLSQSDQFGKLVASIVDTNLFEGEMRVVAERCVTYWRNHNEAPKVHTADLFADILEDQHNRKASTYRRLLDGMEQLFDGGINAQYVLDQLNTFTRLQKLKDAILQAAQQLNSPQETTITQVEELLSDILRARNFQFDPGIRLSNYRPLLDYLENQYTEFDVGIEIFDHFHAVPSRGTLFMLLGSAGLGKTWGCIHLAKRAIMRRKKVLHISPEVSAEEVQMRYYQSIFAASKRATTAQILRFQKSRSGELTGWEIEDVDPQFHFDSADTRNGRVDVELELQKHIQTYGTRIDNLIIKRVAPRALSTNGLRGMLDSLERVENFIPDMLIVDSCYLLKTDAKDYRISLGRMIEDLRAIAVERNLAMVASHQISREGAKSKRAGQTHVAEDWSIIGTADIVVSFSATEAEQQHGLARLYADKVRTEKGKFGVLMSQSYDIGQFVLDAVVMKPAYNELLEQLAAEPLIGESEDGDEDRDYDSPMEDDD